MKFYKQEIEYRRVLKYPPFCDIIKLEVNGIEEKNVKKTITEIYEKILKTNIQETQIFAPMPSPISKIKNRYRWRIIIKCLVGNNIITNLNNVINATNTNQDIRINVDINPNNMN